MLVVVAILVVLISMLMPAISLARFNAKNTMCMANERLLVQAMTAYAVDYNGYFPRQDAYEGGGDTPEEVTSQFWTLMTKTYGVPQSAMFCTLEEPDQIQLYRRYAGYNIYEFGYALWVPRADYAEGMFPPTGPHDGRVKNPSGSAAGPVSLRDRVGVTAPVLTDQACFYNYSPPSGFFDDPTVPIAQLTYDYAGSYYGSQEIGYCHQLPSGRLGSINEAFSDGHVERREPHALRIQYWNGPYRIWR